MSKFTTIRHLVKIPSFDDLSDEYSFPGLRNYIGVMIDAYDRAFLTRVKLTSVVVQEKVLYNVEIHHYTTFDHNTS